MQKIDLNDIRSTPIERWLRDLGLGWCVILHYAHFMRTVIRAFI